MCRQIYDRRIICLIGPSGSGKTTVAQALMAEGDFMQAKTTTTRAKRDNETDEAYHFVSEQEFERMKSAGEFVEDDLYNKNRYGLTRAEIESIMKSGKKAVIVLTVVGAIRVKETFEDAKIIYTHRNVCAMIESLNKRNISAEERRKRIHLIRRQVQDVLRADYIVNNISTPQYAAKEIRRYLDEVW